MDYILNYYTVIVIILSTPTYFLNTIIRSIKNKFNLHPLKMQVSFWHLYQWILYCRKDERPIIYTCLTFCLSTLSSLNQLFFCFVVLTFVDFLDF